MINLEKMEDLKKKLKNLALDPQVIRAKKLRESEPEFSDIFDSSLLERYNNCFSNENDITLVILDKKAYIIPSGIIKEFYFICAGLYLEDIHVPLSDGMYEFEDKGVEEKWKKLLSRQEKVSPC